MKQNWQSSSFVDKDAMWKPWVSGSWNPSKEKEREKSIKWVDEAWNLLEPFCPGVHLAQIHSHMRWHSKEVETAFKDWLPKLKQLKSTYDPQGILPPL